MSSQQVWNPRQYAEHARFVTDLGAPLIELLAPKAGERILDLGCGDGVLTKHLMDRPLHTNFLPLAMTTYGIAMNTSWGIFMDKAEPPASFLLLRQRDSNVGFQREAAAPLGDEPDVRAFLFQPLAQQDQPAL